MYYCMGGGVCQALFLRRQTDATKRGGGKSDSEIFRLAGRLDSRGVSVFGS